MQVRQHSLLDWIPLAMLEIESCDGLTLFYFSDFLIKLAKDPEFAKHKAAYPEMKDETDPQKLKVAWRNRGFPTVFSTSKYFTFEENKHGETFECGFRLKENTSASHALMHFYKKAKTVLDCTLVINLARPVAFLYYFQERLGNEGGNFLFDHWFGATFEATPAKYRLHINDNVSYCTSIERFIKRVNPPETKTPTVRYAQLVYFKNHPDYLKKHPSGNAQGWNVYCVGVNGENEPCFLGFGLGREPQTTTQILMRLRDEYNLPAEVKSGNFENHIKLSDLSPVPFYMEPLALNEEFLNKGIEGPRGLASACEAAKILQQAADHHRSLSANAGQSEEGQAMTDDKLRSSKSPMQL